MKEAACKRNSSEIKQGTLNYTIESGAENTIALTVLGKTGGICLEFEPHEIDDLIHHLELGKSYSLDQQEYLIFGVCFDRERVRKQHP